MDSAIKLV